MMSTKSKAFVLAAAVAAAAAAALWRMPSRTAPETAPEPGRPVPTAAGSDRGWDDADLAPQYPRYSSPESLLDDYDNAMRFTVSTEAVNHYLAQYFACSALREGSTEACGKIDARLNERETMSCEEVLLTAQWYVETVRGGGAVEKCLREDAYYGRIMGEPHNEKESTAVCTSMLPYFFSGDMEGYCRQVVRQLQGGHKADGNITDMASCRSVMAFLAGDPERCPPSAEEIDAQMCRERAKLLLALRRGEPELAAGTVYFPVFDRKASCEGAARRALEVYREKAVEQSERESRLARDRRFAQQEDMRSRGERAAAELRAREALEDLAAKARAAERQRREADRQAVADAESKKAQEIQRNFERARQEDEAAKGAKKP